jgi:hypothetical protein
MTPRQQKIYMQRLKRMLEKYPNNGPNHCPAQSRFKSMGSFINVFGGVWAIDPEVCNFCNKIVRIRNSCPCERLGPQKATKRAWEAIKKWEKEHGKL